MEPNEYKDLADSGWESMQQLLDEHLPVEPKKRKKRFFFWFFLFGVILLSAALIGLSWPDDNTAPVEQKGPQVAPNPMAGINTTPPMDPINSAETKTPSRIDKSKAIDNTNSISNTTRILNSTTTQPTFATLTYDISRLPLAQNRLPIQPLSLPHKENAHVDVIDPRFEMLSITPNPALEVPSIPIKKNKANKTHWHGAIAILSGNNRSLGGKIGGGISTPLVPRLQLSIDAGYTISRQSLTTKAQRFGVSFVDDQEVFVVDSTGLNGPDTILPSLESLDLQTATSYLPGYALFHQAYLSVTVGYKVSQRFSIRPGVSYRPALAVQYVENKNQEDALTTQSVPTTGSQNFQQNEARQMAASSLLSTLNRHQIGTQIDIQYQLNNTLALRGSYYHAFNTQFSKPFTDYQVGTRPQFVELGFTYSPKRSK